jgi:hypothetical protein
MWRMLVSYKSAWRLRDNLDMMKSYRIDSSANQT